MIVILILALMAVMVLIVWDLDRKETMQEKHVFMQEEIRILTKSKNFWCKNAEALAAENKELKAKLESLEMELEEAKRANKRYKRINKKRLTKGVK